MPREVFDPPSREASRSPISSDGPAPWFTPSPQVVGQLMAVAKDQNGCRFLQRKFDEGGPAAVAVVFTEVRGSGNGLGRDNQPRRRPKTMEDSSLFCYDPLPCSRTLPRLPHQVLENLVQLMVDPFGNYLVQKLLDRCSEQQRLEVRARARGKEDDLLF